MTRRRRVPYLRLVTSDPDQAADASPGQRRRRSPVQLSLFHEPSPSLLGFLDTHITKGKAFAAILRRVRPTWLLDLRPVPLFDLDPRFNRRMAFRLFEENGVEYRDVARDLGIQERRDPRLRSGVISQEINALLSRSRHPGPSGPIVFLLDHEYVMETATRILPRTLQPRPRGGWQVHIFDPRAELVTTAQRSGR